MVALFPRRFYHYISRVVPDIRHADDHNSFGIGRRTGADAGWWPPQMPPVITQCKAWSSCCKDPNNSSGKPSDTYLGDDSDPYAAAVVVRFCWKQRGTES